MPYSANPHYAGLYDSSAIGVPLPVLSTALNAPVFFDLRRQIERAVNIDDFDYEKRRRLPLDDRQIDALRNVTGPIASWCAQTGLDRQRVNIGVFDRLSGQTVALASRLGDRHYICLSRALLATAPAPALAFIVAHEFAHLLNGDNRDDQHKDDKKVYSAGGYKDKAHWRPVRRRLQAVELRADARGMTMFPSLAEGLAALTAGMAYLQETMHDGRGRHRLRALNLMHPSHVARIRHAERLVVPAMDTAIQRYHPPCAAEVSDEAPLITEPERLRRHFAYDETGPALCRFIAEVAERAGPQARFVRIEVVRGLETETRSFAALRHRQFGIVAQPTYELATIQLSPSLLKPDKLLGAKFAIAHELAHYLNGDFSNQAMVSALGELGAVWSQTTKPDWRLGQPSLLQAYRTVRRHELAADIRALGLFADRAEALQCQAAWLAENPGRRTGRQVRLNPHPSNRVRQHLARRACA